MEHDVKEGVGAVQARRQQEQSAYDLAVLLLVQVKCLWEAHVAVQQAQE